MYVGRRVKARETDVGICAHVKWEGRGDYVSVCVKGCVWKKGEGQITTIKAVSLL